MTPKPECALYSQKREKWAINKVMETQDKKVYYFYSQVCKQN